MRLAQHHNFMSVDAFPQRLDGAYELVLRGYNNTERDPNPYMHRLAYYYAMIRLGSPGFKLDADEFGASYRAVTLLILPMMNQERSGTNKSAWPLLGMYLLSSHLEARGYAPIHMKTSGESESSAKERKSHSRRCRISAPQEPDGELCFQIERRPKVFADLRELVKKYEQQEPVLFGEKPNNRIVGKQPRQLLTTPTKHTKAHNKRKADTRRDTTPQKRRQHGVEDFH